MVDRSPYKQPRRVHVSPTSRAQTGYTGQTGRAAKKQPPVMDMFTGAHEDTPTHVNTCQNPHDEPRLEWTTTLLYRYSC